MIKIQTKLPNERRNKKKNSKKRTRFIVILVFDILMVFALAFGYWLYRTLLSPNVQTPTGTETAIYIPTGSDYDQVKAILKEANVIINEKSFYWVAQKKKYPENIRPGRYIVDNTMSNNDIINMLRGGLQSPIRVTFNNIRDVDMPHKSKPTPFPFPIYFMTISISTNWASIVILFLLYSCLTHTNSIGAPMQKVL